MLLVGIVFTGMLADLMGVRAGHRLRVIVAARFHRTRVTRSPSRLLLLADLATTNRPLLPFGFGLISGFEQPVFVVSYVFVKSVA